MNVDLTLFLVSFFCFPFVTFFFLKKRKWPKKIQERKDYIPFLSLFPDLTIVLLWLQHSFFMLIPLQRLQSSGYTSSIGLPWRLFLRPQRKGVKKISGTGVKKWNWCSKCWIVLFAGKSYKCSIMLSCCDLFHFSPDR